MAGRLDVDDRRRPRRFRAHHYSGTAPNHERLVRALIGPFRVSANRVASEKETGVALSGWTRFALAVVIILVGRLVLKIEGRGTFLLDLSRCWKEGCF
jgi:hypothetical protein